MIMHGQKKTVIKLTYEWAYAYKCKQDLDKETKDAK